MQVRKVFKCGSAVVVALPRAWREALGIMPGTAVVMSLKDRRITVERALISGAGVPDPTARPEKVSHD